MVMSNSVPTSKSDMWPEERSGYDERIPVAYAPVTASGASFKSKIPLWVKGKTAAFIAACGLLWSAQVLTAPISRVANLTATPGPLEICAVSILIWLHTKWRRSVGH